MNKLLKNFNNFNNNFNTQGNISFIKVDLNIYLPRPYTYYSYFEMLKSHNYIDNIEIDEKVFQIFLEIFI